jgi:hypothetical protein
MPSKSARPIFNFLHQARSWLRIVAASGVDFSETVAAGAEFCFSGQEFRLNFLTIGALCLKLRSQFHQFLFK